MVMLTAECLEEIYDLLAMQVWSRLETMLPLDETVVLCPKSQYSEYEEDSIWVKLPYVWYLDDDGTSGADARIVEVFRKERAIEVKLYSDSVGKTVEHWDLAVVDIYAQITLIKRLEEHGL